MCSVVSGLIRRFIWSIIDVDVIIEVFKVYDKCLIKKEICVLFESVEEFMDIAERNIINRCYEKVKIVFR